jgi:miniconductance mechanosensitive channel
MDRSPVIFLSGLGAMTAVLLLVFRDTILSLVAGVQMTTNDLIRVGDWIEMPQFQADGDVVAINLNSITVQNWDRTLTVIPAHKFLEHSFRNWRGMQESGGRRIKRAFHVDQTTVRFLTDEEVERFERWELLGDYIRRKREEVEAHNREHPSREGEVEMPHQRRLTNVGTLRAYLIEYLRNHPGVRQDMILLVRQLEPGPEGLPIEIYVFSADTRWVQHEGLQADIFDHILAMVPEFGLRVYQKPSGADLHGALAGR